MRQIFWNEAEQRLRAGWRLVLQIVVLLAFLIPVQVIVFGVVAVAGVSPEAFVDAVSGEPSDGIAMGVAWGQVALGFGTTIVMVLSVWLSGRFFDQRRFVGFGMRLDGAWWLDLLAGIVLAGLLQTLIFNMHWGFGWVRIDGVWTGSAEASVGLLVVAGLLNMLNVGFYEELFSRGYQLLNLAEGLSRFGERTALLVAWVVSSAVFGALHLTNPNAGLISTANIVLAGLFLGLPFIMTRRLG
ncbi:MAG: CPBP family intramembrane glutamic endopeptidase, partial [Chloroflexota bacterium]